MKVVRWEWQQNRCLLYVDFKYLELFGSLIFFTSFFNFVKTFLNFENVLSTLIAAIQVAVYNY